MNIYKQLKRDEGEVLHAYKDSLGYWTIGIGILIDSMGSFYHLHLSRQVVKEN
jgi:GH24 family phage-related lysozyme (muramidase)